MFFGVISHDDEGEGDLKKDPLEGKIGHPSDNDFTPIFWWDPWSYVNDYYALYDRKIFVWYTYERYLLSIFGNWHILENRILIFFIFILFWFI